MTCTEPKPSTVKIAGMSKRGRRSVALVFASAGALAAALALAGGIAAVEAGRQGERAVLAAGILIASVLLSIPAAYLIRSGRRARPGTFGLAVLTACAVSLLGIYFFWVASYVTFPADMLIWSEGDFVNDILKFSVGYPIYTPQINNNSMNYVPGAQLLTHLIASVAGKPWSIPTLRGIQLGYAAMAAFIALLCCRKILILAFPGSRAAEGWLWNAFLYSTLLLIATNSLTNHFAHNLHADSLAEVANVTALYLLLCYIDSRSPRVLAAMAVIVTAGFFIRQNILLWGVLYGGFLLFWDSWKRLAIFAAAAAGLYGAAIAAAFAVWGRPFYYWVFFVLTRHAFSPFRSLQHGLDAWTYFAALMLGAAAVLRSRNLGPLLGAWLACLLVLGSETFTSGWAWMLNHMGPGSLMSGIWFLAGLCSAWASVTDSAKPWGMENLIRTGAVTATVVLMASGFGVIRIPLRPIPDDAYRYVHDIEAQFRGIPAQRVLLDLGTWPYIKEKAIVGDRAASIGDRGYAGTGDFSGLISRIASKHYSKILVHGYHSYDFVYDYYLFPKPTGIRQSLLDNYRETGTIRAVEGNPYLKDWAEDPFYFGEISILEPKP